MFSTNLIQSNYGDLNIKSLAFDSFKERLESTMAALTFFISTGQCDCDEIAESNFNYMIAYGRCEQVPDMRSCLSSGAIEQGSS